MEFPASQLYIMLAISGATLGVYVSNSKDFKMSGRNFLIVPLLFVFFAWSQLLATLLLHNKPYVDNTWELYTHILTLYLFAVSSTFLARDARDARDARVQKIFEITFKG